jgi:hypothetical protein
MSKASQCFNRIISAISLFAVSSLAQAGSSLTFTYAVVAAAAPPGAPPAVAPVAVEAAPVPLASDALLVVLGLLLAVIAWRTFRSSEGAKKLMSLALLGGGLAVGGLGVDYALATEKSIPPEGSDCESGTVFVGSPYHGGDITVENTCDKDVEVKRVNTDGACSLDDVIIPVAVFKAGATEPTPYCPGGPA